ncbi:hypothetical protein M409DRAFT_66607 [Zasmidium cellare ATCC 36951]|uniref:CAAX prenyl protease n=1 Tax=Zasmidium cellare ATCC 36951 TaxID=1080233 RepID=A0A6A6CKB7_ZASCE|nr:uncharacterized protein M409DRAFT_66607 [Zasmidium cellare ATCC 36951]KAF2166600.1 hypothetical protein M409DRAFT_66607 [Zasmidium cellare ATCC 36951]
MDLLRDFTLDNPAIPWKTWILRFGFIEFALETYLLYRQYWVLCSGIVPKQLEKEIDQDTFDKSQRYGRAKAKFGVIKSVFSLVKNVYVIQKDLLPYAWDLSAWVLRTYAPRWMPTGEIATSLVFVFGFQIVEMVVDLPFGLWYHFVLEESFGFNKQTYSLYFTDKLKGIALSIVFGVPIGAGFLKIIQSTGNAFFLYVWVFMLAVQLVGITIYPTLIVPLFNKLTPLEPGELKERVEGLAKRLNFPLAELQVIDGSKRSAHSNAYFTGLPFLPKKIVIYDTLLEKAETKEVEAVLAHELGHWKMGHTSKLLGISSGHLLFVFALFSVFIDNKSLYEAFGFFAEKPIVIGFLLFNDVLSPTDALVKFAMNALTRKFEFEADEFSQRLGYAKELAGSLIKLQIQNLSSMDADPWYSSYHYSHPILTERLKAVGWTSEKKVSNEKPKIGESVEANGGSKKEL